MTEFLPPGRSIERVTVTPEGVEVWCDCATITVLDFRDVPPTALPLERAFTCNGCHSVHWFTLGAVHEDGAA